jgi:exopolysaccharide production protein ExoZ
MAKIDNIQVLRAVAALMVVVYHCGVEVETIAATGQISASTFTGALARGVPLFFVISGFIMVVTTAGRFGEPGAAVDFFRRRIVRIVPLYWIVTAAALTATILLPQLTKGSTEASYVVSSFLFWPAARPDGYLYPLATPGWTLNHEMMFYGLFALALLASRRTGLLLLSTVLLVLIAARAASLVPDGSALDFWGRPIVLGFLAGIAVGLIAERGLRLGAAASLLLLAAGFVLLLVPESQSHQEEHFWSSLIAAIAAALIVLAAAIGPQISPKGIWGFVVSLGEASFALYLTHFFLLRVLRVGWVAALPAQSPLWLFFVLGSVASTAVALAVWRWVELPMSRSLAPPRRASQAGRRHGPAAAALMTGTSI